MEQKEVKTAKKQVKPNKKAVKAVKKADKPVLPHVSNMINFDVLFRAKGVSGLWVMRSGANSRGFINMSRFMQFDVSKTFKVVDLTSLGSLVFQTELGKDDLRFRDVFRNIFDNEVEFLKLPIEKQMEIAVPCFDDDCFKGYHMQKICKWYNEIKKGVGDEIRDQKKNIEKTVTD